MATKTDDSSDANSVEMKQKLVDDNGKSKKRSFQDRMRNPPQPTAWWVGLVRMLFYEMVFSFASQYAYIFFLMTLPFSALWAAAGVEVALGAVLKVTLGVVGNPLLLVTLACLKFFMDGEREIIESEESVGKFLFKTVVLVIGSLAGASLGGLTARSILGSAKLADVFLPALRTPSTGAAPGVVGLVVGLLYVFYYHIHINLSIHTEDGYGMMLKFGIAQVVFGMSTLMLWNVVPNINYTISAITAAYKTTDYAGFSVVVEVIALILTAILYAFITSKFFGREIIESNGKKEMKNVHVESYEGHPARSYSRYNNRGAVDAW